MHRVVDTETASEFMRETLEQVDREELARIATEIEAKSAWFQARLSAEAWADLIEEDYAKLIRGIFSARKRAKELNALFGFEDVRAWAGELLHGEDAIEVRFQAFGERLEGLPVNMRNDLASELLHFTFPERYWLWTRWVWDPRTRTGSLPLVTSAAYDLSGDNAGDIYVKVGKGIGFVHAVGQSAGFQTIGKTVFATDVYLCCVYVVYAYTVLRMRMTNEFNKVMPGLPEFCRRLLGVHVKRPAA